MGFSDLPPELVLQVAEHLDYERDLNSFVQTNRWLYQCLNDFLYRYAMKMLSYDAIHRQVALNSLSAVKKSLRIAQLSTGEAHDLSYLLNFAMSKGYTDMTKLLAEEGIRHEESLGPDRRNESLGRWNAKVTKDVHSCAHRLNFTQAIKRRQMDMIPWIIAQHESWPPEAVLGHARMAIVHGDLEILKFIDQELAKSPDWQAIPGNISPIQFAMQTIEGDVNRTTLFDESLLQDAVGTEDWPIVEYLIDMGANVIYNDGGRRALEITIQHGNVKIIRLFQQKNAQVDFHIPEDDNLLLLLCAAVSNVKKPEITITELTSRVNVDKIMANPGKDLNTLLLIAASCGLLDLTKSILDNGGDPNAEPACSPLALAARRGHLEVATILLENKADVNGNSTPGHTESTSRPLYEACENDHVEVAELLLQHGALGDSRHLFASFAAQPALKHPRIIELLILRGDTNPSPWEWDFMVTEAVRGGYFETVRIMMKHKALVLRHGGLLWTEALASGVEMLELIKEYMGGIPQEDRDVQNAVREAIFHGQSKEALFFHKAGVHLTEEWGGNASKFQNYWVHIELARAAIMSDNETVELLLGDQDYADVDIAQFLDPEIPTIHTLHDGVLPQALQEVFELGRIPDTGSLTEAHYYRNLLRVALAKNNNKIFDQVYLQLKERVDSSELDRIVASVWSDRPQLSNSHEKWIFESYSRRLESAYWRAKYPVDSV